MIEVTNLIKQYGRLKALDDVSAGIESGKVTAVLGPNGAGKTTLIKCLLGLVKPDSGTMMIDGEEITGKSAYRKKIGYMPQSPAYPENLTVQEIFDMIRDLRVDTTDHSGAGIDNELIDMFRLEPEMNKTFKKLSGGNKQKTSAVIAFMFRPQLLFLDEPTAGLDPVASSHLKDKIAKERDNGKTIVLTSHIMSDIQELASDIVYLVEGRLHFHKTVKNLLEETGEHTLERAVAHIMEERSYANAESN
jgi:Cu-processing system ATP-binding protein